MGQILRPDYIPALVKTSATQLKLPSGAWITIGGRQYRTAADTFLNVTLSANTLYMVYAVVTGGTISLVQSTNVNSVGPAGYAQWALVGAFYSDGLASISIGSFVSIDGVPTSQTVSYLPVWTATSVNPAIGNGSIVGKFSRRADIADIQIGWTFGSSTSFGTGSWRWSLPVTMDVDKIAGTNIEHILPNSALVARDAGNNIYHNAVSMVTGSATTIKGSIATSGAEYGPSSPFVWGSADEGNLSFSVPVSGWSNTPLRYL